MWRDVARVADMRQGSGSLPVIQPFRLLYFASSRIHPHPLLESSPSYRRPKAVPFTSEPVRGRSWRHLGSNASPFGSVP